MASMFLVYSVYKPGLELGLSRILQLHTHIAIKMACDAQIKDASVKEHNHASHYHAITYHLAHSRMQGS